MKEAAAAASISERTLYAYLHDDPEFAARHAAARDQLLTDATDALRRNAMLAIDTLRSVLENKRTKPSVRVAASRALLDYTLRMNEAHEVAIRLQRLEGFAAEAQ